LHFVSVLPSTRDPSAELGDKLCASFFSQLSHDSVGAHGVGP
jgi:hypothetical protein